MATTTMTVAQTVEAYFAAWNEPDAAKRRALIDQCWAEDALYCDPQADVRGRDGLDETIAGFHKQAPGARIEVTSTIDQHHNQLRFLWAFRTADGNTPIEGIDIGELAQDGRLSRIVGFWGTPAAK